MMSDSPRIMSSDVIHYNGISTCDENNKQVTSLVRYSITGTLPSGNSWSCQQNNTTNAYYVAVLTGTVNNNNKNNTYAVVPVAELDRMVNLLLVAEEDCYKNKKNRLAALKFHFNIRFIYTLVEELFYKTYIPGTSICFVLTKPTIREVFASNYRDRITHHLIAPFIMSVTEKVHEINGNISHGNRHKLSAQTAALQIQKNMKKYPNGYVIHMDISGFFMSLDRNLCYEIFVNFLNKYKPIQYTDDEIEFYLWLLKILIMNDPASNCEIHSPKTLLEKVPKNKSLFNRNRKGLPIGNFYSQLIANLISSIWGATLKCIPGILVTQFVDDCTVVVSKKELINPIRITSEWILSSIGLLLHHKKFYCQPVKHGVSFCGRVIYKDRIYIENRTVHNCMVKIHTFIHGDINLETSKKLLNSINSYIGMICHCRSYNIQKELMNIILNTKFSSYLYFKEKNKHLVCVLRNKYKDKNIYNKEITNISNKYNDFKYEEYKYISRAA